VAVTFFGQMQALACVACHSEKGLFVSITLGPIAFPLAPLLLLLCVWLTSWVAAKYVASDQAAQVKDDIQHAAWVGLAGARFAHLLMYAPLYVDTPWSVLDIRDGGWVAPAGVVAGLLWLGWRGHKRGWFSQQLGYVCLVGSLAWLGATYVAEATQLQAAPDVQVLSLEDEVPHSLAQLGQGKPLVVNLWASWCGPCRQEMPALAQAQRSHPHVVFAFVNQGEAQDTVQGFLQRQPWQIENVWLDAKGATGQAVGSRSLPTTLFYDAQGQLVASHFGVLTPIAIQVKLSQLR
jgi:thiol-disulfide isomerase/thioredoxin